MDAVILAAGFGLRLGNFTESMPKTLLRIKGQETILSRLIETLLRATISKIHIIAGFQAEKIKNHINHFNSNDVTVLVAKDYKKGPLYTFKEAEEIGLQEDFLLLPSDIIFQDNFLFEFIREHEQGNFCTPYTRKEELDEANILFINEEESRAIGFNKKILMKPFTKVTPIPAIILNFNVYRFVDVAIKLKCTRVIQALNLAIELNQMIHAKDYSGTKWLDVDTPEIYDKIK